MSATSLRTYATATAAAALLGASAFLAPAVAQAQIVDPIDPTDILKIDSPDLTVDVHGNTADFTVTAPENMACIGPLLYEGSISDSDIDPDTWDQSYFEELFATPVWPTNESDLHVVVNESSPLADQPGASASPFNVSVPGLNDGDYVATSLCVNEDYVDPIGMQAELTTFQEGQLPVEMHFRNFSVVTTGSVSLGSVDVFGSLGSIGS